MAILSPIRLPLLARKPLFHRGERGETVFMQTEAMGLPSLTVIIYPTNAHRPEENGAVLRGRTNSSYIDVRTELTRLGL